MTERWMDGIQEVTAIKENLGWGWRDGTAAKSDGCSSRGAIFRSQHLHGSSQASMTRVPDLMTSSDLWWAAGIHLLHGHIKRQSTHTHKINYFQNC